MNAQKRDLVIAAKEVARKTGEHPICAGCGCSLDSDKAFASCYCKKCEDEIYETEFAYDKLASGWAG